MEPQTSQATTGKLELDNKSGIEEKRLKSDSENEKTKDKKEIQYFQCTSCNFREKFDYFGREPPFLKNYKLLEDAYVIEDPFLAAKQGRIIILGSYCIQCTRMVCKDINCSMFFKNTFCIHCAKKCLVRFPQGIQEKLNRIII